MLGVENYGSDSDSDAPTPSTTQVKPKRVKKIAIPALPSVEPSTEDHVPAAKKQKLSSGAGMSSLLSILPKPKQKGPPVPERVLGSGAGLMFKAAPDPTSVAPPAEVVAISSTLLVPTSLRKESVNISLEKRNTRPYRNPLTLKTATVDFFSLDSPSCVTASTSDITVSESKAKLALAVSAAPEVHTYVPPPPTLDDPYPGYYELPQGGYAAYDSEYYRAYHDKWTKDYNDHVRALERGGGRGFEGYEQGDVEEVDMTAERERAMKEIKEREARKALTAPGKRKGSDELDDDDDAEKDGPKMNIKGAKLGRVAKTRHQLTTLLTDAYSNREIIEEKIAQGKRNRKEAGNKYGF